MIVVIGSIVTTTETHGKLLALSIEHCARSRLEPGCAAHNVHADCENPMKLVFVEYWTTMDALKAHFAVPASQAFGKALYKLGASPPEIKVFDAEEVRVGSI